MSIEVTYTVVNIRNVGRVIVIENSIGLREMINLSLFPELNGLSNDKLIEFCKHYTQRTGLPAGYLNSESSRHYNTIKRLRRKVERRKVYV